MKLRKIYPANLQPGMLVVGIYDPNAPTNPVREMAVGLRVAEITYWSDDTDSGRDSAICPVWEGNLYGGFVDYSSGVKYLVIEEG